MLTTWFEVPPRVVEQPKPKPKGNRRAPVVIGGRRCCETYHKPMSKRTLIHERWCSKACIRVTPPPLKPMTFGLEVLAALRQGATIQSMSKALRRTPTRVLDSLQRLERRGLVVRDGDVWRAA